MECQEVKKLLDNESTEPSKFRTKNWVWLKEMISRMRLTTQKSLGSRLQC